MKGRSKKSDVNRSGARRLGDEYQDAIALEVLVEWLEHPNRFQWVRLEADDLEFLDDVVALRSDNTIDVIQVKHSTHPEDPTDPWNWTTLLAKKVGKDGHPTESLIQKWAKSLHKIQQDWSVHEACVITNRKPAADLRESLSDSLVIFDKIASQDTRDEISKQLDSEVIARDFFAQFHFYLDQPDWNALEQAVSRRFFHLGGDEKGWNSLKNSVRSWVKFRNEPPPDGKITLSRVQTASLWHELQSFPQEFEIPSDYVLPSEQFHTNLLKRLLGMSSGTLVLYASPGIGKSTYTSFLYQELKGKGIPVIRHHYFLSLSDRDWSLRIDHVRAIETLMADIKDQYSDAIGDLNNKNPALGDFREWLETCGSYYASQGKVMIVILDGLDHVWREQGSIQELGRVLDNFQPPIDGIVLYVATQPIDDEKLPGSLLRAAPRDTWLELPALDELSVRSWVEIHSNDLEISQVGPAREHLLENLSAAFYNKSNGHPLHLKYSLRALQEQGITITQQAIEQLPECPHQDIVSYYKELWRRLPEDSHLVIHLFAISMFPWPQIGLCDCLVLQGIQPHQAIIALRQIRHLLFEGEIGLQPFHSSLLNFVRDLPEHPTYGTFQKPRVLEWLQTKAPDHWRWSYEWLIADDLGENSLIIDAPNRQWLIDALAKCRTKRDIERILERSAAAALKSGNLPRAVETGILREYLNIAFDFVHEILEDLLYTQLIVEDDSLLRARLRSNLRELTPAEIYMLAESEANSGNANVVKRCYDELNSEVRIHRLKISHEVPSKWEQWTSSTLKVAALCQSVIPGHIISWALRNRENGHTLEMLEIYCTQLRVQKDITRFRELLFKKMTEEEDGISFENLDPQEQAIIIRDVILLALEEGLKIDDCLFKLNWEASPFVVIYAVLRKVRGFEPREIPFPEIRLLNLNRYEVYAHTGEIKTLYYITFFTLLLHHLIHREDLNRDWLEDIGEFSWPRHFTQLLNKTAYGVANLLLQGAHLSLGWFYGQFSELSVPQFQHGEGDYYYYIAATSALARIGLDLLCLSRTEDSVPSISLDTIKTIAASPYFNPETWLMNYIGQRRKLLETEAARWFLSKQKNALLSKIAPLNERSKSFCELATLSALHNLDDLTRELIWLTAENLIGHFSHKDLLINEVIEVILAYHSAVAHLNTDELGFVKPEECLLALAPAVARITEFTDGDETGHLPEKNGRCSCGNQYRSVAYLLPMVSRY